MSMRNTVYVGPFLEISSPIELDFSELTEDHFFDVTHSLAGSVPGKKFLIPNLKYPGRNFSIDAEQYCDQPYAIEGIEEVQKEIMWVIDQLKPYVEALGKKYQDHPDFDASNSEQYQGNVLWGVLVYAN